MPENGNVDIVKNRQVINIPFIKNSANIIGSKTINNIHVSNGVAFLSCSFGLVKLNINQAGNIGYTITFGTMVVMVK